MSGLADRLRKNYPAGAHWEAAGTCVCCFEDWPCDWSGTFADIHEAADEVDRLQAWKDEAITVLGEWDACWVNAGQPGPLGSSKARSTADEIDRLRKALGE